MNNKLLYLSWLKEHKKKRKEILNKIKYFTKYEKIKYFDFENMKIKELNFCVLYSVNKKCHNVEKLNCYFCACPHFVVENIQSSCSIDSKKGFQIINKDNYLHQDCSQCTIPHSEKYVKNNI